MSNGKHIDDVRLVDAILAGSVDAWHEFITLHAGIIEAVLRKKLFDLDETRDVFVGLLHDLLQHKLASYRGEASLATWLAVVTRRAATDAIRRRLGRFRPGENLDGSPGPDRVTSLERHLRAEQDRRQARTPEHELITADRERQARELPGLIAELPESARHAIVLRFERGMSAQRIAREMGLKDQRRAYTIVDRAIRRLRRLADERR